MIRRIFPGPKSESLNIRVSFESLKGMWLLDCEVSALIIKKLQRCNGPILKDLH